jgi:hypothetical protein
LNSCIPAGDLLTLLELGTAKVDITPRIPVPLAGFGFRTGVFGRVETPLFARIFCFKGAGERPIILVSADLIWWGSDRIDGMRQRIRSLEGLTSAVVLLHATHSHSGPQTTDSLSPDIGTASPAYIQALEDTVIRGIHEAAAAVEPVTAERGAGRCVIGIHRRRLVHGSIQMAPNPEGPNDRECTVIRFRRKCGSTKAVLVHFTCHPTTTAENSVSAEFCGAAMTEIERQENGVVAAYLQGCCGDIRPALVRDDQFYRGGAADVRRLGAELANAISSVLHAPMNQCEPASCSAFEVVVPLAFENTHETVQMTMTLIRLTPNLGFLTFNAETVVEYGLYVKRHFRGAILPLGYTNGMIGYVTTERQLIEGGYESREAFRYFAMPGPFHAATERQVKKSINDLLRR